MRKRFVLWVGAALSVACLENPVIGAARRGACGPGQPEAAGRPNVILVMTDDQEAASLSLMPFTREDVNSRGVTFQSAFVTTPLCCPSRVSILRGQYAHSHRVTSNELPFGGYPLFRLSGGERSTISTWLDSVGYCTAFVGKYLNGYGNAPQTPDWAYIPPGWDEWHAVVAGVPAGSRYVDFTMNENGQLLSYRGSDNYEADVLRRKAVAFLQAVHEGRRQPFFLWIAPFAPHDPMVPAPRHMGMYSHIRAPRQPSFNEADVTDKAARIRTLPLLTDSAVAEIDNLYRRRAETLLAVDELLAAVLEELRSLGLDSTTYVFLTSDNGFHMGQHRLPPGKSLPYDEDLRVPLLAWGPDVVAGLRIPDLVLNVDLAPTFAELAGVAAPSFVEGRSLVPFLRGQVPSGEWRQGFLAEHWLLAEIVTPIRSFEAVRTANWKYIRWNTGEIELYNLAQDSFELNNLIGVTDTTTSARFGRWLDALGTCVAATCRLMENAPP